MPNPTPAQVHVDRPLTNISVAYQQRQADYVADRVFPRVPVLRQSDKYFKYTKGDWFRTEVGVRPPSTESPGSGYRITTDTYFCEPYAVHRDVDQQLRANADAPLDMDREATLFVTNQLLLKRDIQWADTFFKTGVWATDVTGVTSTPNSTQFLQWDQSGSDPLVDIDNAKMAVKQATGAEPNVLVIDPLTYVNGLKHNASILDRIKHTQRGVITRELLANLFDVEEVLIAQAVQNTAAEAETESMSFIFGKGALLVHRAPNPGLMTPTGGYIFTWNGYLGGNAFGTAIDRFEMRNIKSTRVEGEMSYDMKVIANDMGYYFSGTVA